MTARGRAVRYDVGVVILPQQIAFNLRFRLLRRAKARGLSALLAMTIIDEGTR